MGQSHRPGRQGRSPRLLGLNSRQFIHKRGPLPNLSTFAFTATTKAKTLELFGVQRADGKFEPFHLYGMRQAIEEEFILDVLANYTTYSAYWKLFKTIEDDPRYEKKKAAYLLKSFVELHPYSWKCLVAFSGKVDDGGKEYTEPGMNSAGADHMIGSSIRRPSSPSPSTGSWSWRASSRPASTSPFSTPCTWTRSWAA